MKKAILVLLLFAASAFGQRPQQTLFPPGSAIFPGLALENDRRTGFFSIDNSTMGLTVNGREVMRFKRSGFRGIQLDGPGSYITWPEKGDGAPVIGHYPGGVFGMVHVADNAGGIVGIYGRRGVWLANVNSDFAFFHRFEVNSQQDDSVPGGSSTLFEFQVRDHVNAMDEAADAFTYVWIWDSTSGAAKHTEGKIFGLKVDGPNNKPAAVAATAIHMGDTYDVAIKLTNTLFANLRTDVDDGSIVFCADCTIANPCAGSGTGALAKRLNSTWVCN